MGRSQPELFERSVSEMEPLFLDQIPPELADLAAQVVQSVTKLGGGLPPKTLASLADLVRLMNCYYSNLIEGHHTRPRDIDAALQGKGALPLEVSGDRKREDLLALAIAHINTQEWIEQLYFDKSMPDPSSRDFIEHVHQKFYAELPDVFLQICDPETTQLTRVMKAGVCRRAREEVVVGNHHPPSGGDELDAFLSGFSSTYSQLRKMGPVQRLCGIAAAHHRLLYIHPFDDGNGRVARLITHAMTLDAGFGACGLWSMSRGMARGLKSTSPYVPKIMNMYQGVQPQKQYKQFMIHADQARMGDLDGRGNLSRQRLQEFCYWFLSIALDQLEFMRANFKMEEIATNLQVHYARDRKLDARSGRVLAEIARLGELPRSSIRGITGVGERATANVISPLVRDGILTSDDHKSPLRLHFSPDAVEIIFPKLFGPTVVD